MEYLANPAFIHLWNSLLWPLQRLLLGLAAALFLANILEALRWTDHLARLAQPLARLAHLGPASSSAFALAFVSPAAANGLLSENYVKGKISPRELMLANLFNSLPAFCMHLPRTFLLLWPALGLPALAYAALTLGAAIFRALFSIILGNFILPPPIGEMGKQAPQRKRAGFGRAIAAALQSLRKRLPKLLLFTIPFYLLMYFGQQWGLFERAEAWLAQSLSWISFLSPQAMGIIVLQIVAETGATLGAASAALDEGALSGAEIVAALLVGNVLATPLRAIRHQLPMYAGLFRPVMAMKLVAANQGLRIASLAAIICLYAAI